MQKVIFLDLDGTLTPQSTWLLLNQRLGITAEEDHALFEQYLQEAFDYKGWMDELMNLYKRNPLVTKDDLKTFADTIEIRGDAHTAIEAIKAKGYTVAIISGALDAVVQTIATKLGIDIWFAKTSAIFDDQEQFVNVATQGDGERDEKLRIVETYCVENGIDIKEVICVEDGGNGLELFKYCKGILLGNNSELAPLAWKQVQNLSEIPALL